MISIATGDGAHQMHGIHGRFRSRVVEPPQGQVEPSGQLAGDDDRVVGRLGEVSALGDATLHRLDDRRIGVTGDHDAVSAVQVDVFGAVDIPDTRTSAMADPHCRRAGDHPVRCRPTGEHLGGLLGAGERLRDPSYETALFLLDQRIDGHGLGFDDGHSGLSLHC